MVGDYSSFSLRLLNLFIGLCRGAAGLPDDLRTLGYQDCWIEFGFKNSQDEEVCPELILASEHVRHTVLCEWKSGSNVDPDQLSRYSHVTAEDLVQRAFLSRRAVEAHDTSVFGQEENVERLSLGIEQAGCRFPLLGVKSDGIYLRKNTFSRTELTGLFSRGLGIDMETAPMGFVPFDRESPDWVVAQHCCPRIIEYMQKGEPHLLLRKLVSDVCPIWQLLGPTAQADLETRVRRVVLDAARSHLKSYLRRNKQATHRTGTHTWDIVNSPLRLTTDKRTAAWRALSKLAKGFVDSVRAKGIQLAFDPDELE
jgi:hypothetical protein